MKDWDTLAIEFVEHHLKEKDYGFGHRLLCDVMGAWAVFIHSEKLGQRLTYRDTFAIKDSAGQLETPNCVIDTLVVYPNETKRHHILRGLTREWVFRYWQYFRQEEEMVVSRFPAPSTQTTDENIFQSVKPMIEEILTILKPLSLDDGLDFMARLSVAWARCFSTIGFFEWVQSLGYKVPASDRDNFATTTALWFIATYFQSEAL